MNLNEIFDVGSLDRPNYNVAPTNPVPVVRREGSGYSLSRLHWGLIPFWAKDRSIAAKTINARSESVHEKASFRRAFEKRRCLVIADGFYEWERKGRERLPWRIRKKSHEHYAMAGLWDRWKDEMGEILESCTILTVPSNDVVAPLHDRMPAILDLDQASIWLDADAPPEVLKEVLAPFPAEAMEAYRVSPKVNSVAYNSPELTQPFRPAQIELF